MTKESSQVKLLLELYNLQGDINGTDSAAATGRIEEKLAPSLMSRYLALKKRKGTAVAILRNGACSGCNMIYPDSHAAVRHKDFVHTCEFCGRYLVNVDGENDAEDK